MKKDNRGFSLVELIIAVVVFTIVAVPLLNSFVSSARTNQKAKKIMRATAVAENIMEAMNPLTLEEVALQLSNDGDPSHLPVCNLTHSFESHEEMLIDQNAPSPTAGPVYATAYAGSGWQFKGQKSNVYYYALTGVEADSAKYDTLICLDASDYYALAGASGLYNDTELVQISGLDFSKDVMYQLELKEENKVCAEFASRNSRYAATPAEAKHADDFKAALSREVKIEIDNTGSEYEVYLTLTYTAPAGWVADPDRVYTRTMKVFNGAELRNIYILFPPNYNSVMGSLKDVFTIDNRDKVACDVYLIKQVTNPITDLLMKEQQYVPRVQLQEAANGAENLLPANTGVHTNFTVNLGKKEMGATNFYITDPAEYYYNGQNAMVVGELFEPDDLLSEESQNRIYRAEVRVYEYGAYSNATTEFDESKFITSLSN